MDVSPNLIKRPRDYTDVAQPIVVVYRPSKNDRWLPVQIAADVKPISVGTSG